MKPKKRNLKQLFVAGIAASIAVLFMAGAGNLVDGGENCSDAIFTRISGIVSSTVYADIASGTDGTCSWVIDDDGVLTISPTDGVSGQLNSYTGPGASYPWARYMTTVKKVTVEPGVKAGSECYRMFYNFTRCTEMDLKNLDVSQTTDLTQCFYDCTNLVTLDGISDWDVGNVATLNGTFQNCRKLQNVDILANWDTGNVTNMQSTFSGCSGLQNVDGLASWDTGNVTNMQSTFSNCTTLQNVNGLADWDTGNVTTLAQTFQGCSSLQNVDSLTGWDTENVTSLASTFASCGSLQNVNSLANWDTGNVTTLYGTFSSCGRLQNVDSLTNWDTGNVTTLQNIFYYCSGLKNVDGLAGWDTGNVTNMQSAFHSCSNLQNIDGLASWDTGNVTSLLNTFNSCSNLQNIDGLASWDTGNVTSLASTFVRCRSLQNVNGLANWDTGNVTSLASTFYYCSYLQNVDGLANWDTGNVISLTDTFSNCTSLQNVDGLVNWDTGKVTTLQNTFTSSGLRNVDGLANWNTGNVTSLAYTFSNCTSLQNVDGLVNWDTGKVTTLYQTFYECKKLQNVDGLANWNTGKVTTLDHTFYNCTSLQNVDGLTWNTGKVTTLYMTFYNCTSLQNVDGFTNWDTGNVSNMQSTFYNCTSLQNVDGLANWNTGRVTSLSGTFQVCAHLTNVNGLANWNTENVMSLGNTFSSCYALQNADGLSNWNVEKVTMFVDTFANCKSIEALDLSKWNTRSAQYMYQTFYECTALRDLNLAGWKTSEVTDMSEFLKDCRSLEHLDISSMDTTTTGISGTRSYVRMGSMFDHCNALSQITLGKDFSFVGMQGYESTYLSNYGGGYQRHWTYGSPYNHSNALLTDAQRASRGENDPETWTDREFETSYYIQVNALNFLEDGETMTWYLELDGDDPSQTYTSIDDHWIQDGVDANQFKEKDEFGNAGYWSQIGNDWVYTFFVYNKNSDWYAWEDPVHGYQISGYGSINNPSKINKEDMASTPSTTITNVNRNTEFGKIKLTKKLAGIEEYTGDASFVFTVELIDEDDTPVTDNTIIDGHMFVGGKTNIAVRPGTENVVVIDNIPMGYKYRVSEVVPFDYAVTYTRKIGEGGEEALSGEAVSGTVESTDEITINATNTSTKEEKYVDLTVRKALSENNRYETADDAYIFMATFTSLQSQTTYSVDGGENFTSDGDGNATVTFLLQKDQGIVIHDLPVETTYTVSESGGGYTKTVIADTVPEMTLAPSDDFIAEEMPAQAVYSIDKTVTGYDVKLTGMDPETTYTLSTMRSLQSSAEGVLTTTITPAQLLVTELPSGASYTYNQNTGAVTFAGLRANAAYSLNETVTSSGATSFTADENGSATITVNSDPLFANSDLPGTAAYTVTNTDGAYTLAASGLGPNTAYRLSTPVIVTTDDHGNAAVTITNSIPSPSLESPEATKITVKKAADFIASYTITDANTENGQNFINKTSDYSTQPNQPLSTQVETADEGEDVTVTFTNEVRKTEDIKLTKETSFPAGYTPAEDELEFTIGVTFDNLDPNSAIEYSNGLIRADSNGHAERDILIRSGQTIKFLDIPVTAAYSFDEPAMENFRASYTVTDANGTNQIVSASKAADKLNQAISTATETVNEGEDITVTFTNTKTAEPDFSIKKAVTRNTYYNETEKELTYTITVENTGNASGKIIVADPIPDDVTIIDGSISDGGIYSATGYTNPTTSESYTGNVVVWSGPSGDGIEIPAGGAINLSFRAKVESLSPQP